MKTYCIELKLESPVLTPFQADTIFGHLCWMVKYGDGEEALGKFFEPFKRGEPPFLISDGFPWDLLPKPLSAELNITDPIQRKNIKKLKWVEIPDFDRIRRGKTITEFGTKEDKSPTQTTSTHNIINRLTNTTLSEGGVYIIQETLIPEVSIYLKVVSDEWKDKVIELLQTLSKTGYGRKKSIGKGQFSVKEVGEFTFNTIKNANGFITLSNFCPAETDPTEGFYKTFVKYGKLGEEFTFSGNPFKRPLLMVKTGSVFKTNNQPKEFYGHLVQDGIAPAKPEVIQYTYAFAVPVILP